MIGIRKGANGMHYEAYLVSRPEVFTWGTSEAEAVFALVRMLGLVYGL